MSGKSFFEICGGDGTYRQAKIDPVLVPFLASGAPADEAPDPALLDQPCAFCFSHSNLQALVSDETSLLLQKAIIEQVFWAYVQSTPVYLPKPYQSQAPPNPYV